MSAIKPGAEPLISVIVPIYCDGERGALTLGRIPDVLGSFADSRFEVLISDGSSVRARDVEAETLRCGGRYISSPNATEGVFSPGRARDSAVRHAKGRYVLLYDVDLIYPPGFPDEIVRRSQELAENRFSFLMIPCLYLEQGATQLVESRPEHLHALWESYLKGRFEGIINLAVASSLILISRHVYLESGGHRDEFVGHGCEDLEFINRLCLEWPLGRREADHCNDVPQTCVAESRGFRRHFAYYALENAFRGLFVGHRWHPRPVTSRYFRSRVRNDRLFVDFLSLTETTGNAPGAIPDLTAGRKTAVRFASKNETLENYRQLLPAFGEAFLHEAGADLPADVTDLLVISDGAAAIESSGAHVRVTHVIRQQSDHPVWEWQEFDATGDRVGTRLIAGYQRFYADGTSYRWIFNPLDAGTAKDGATPSAAVFDKAAVTLPPLDEFIRGLLHQYGLSEATHPGLFMNQFSGRAPSQRFVRKLRKLLLNPQRFVADSREWKKLRQWWNGGRRG